MAVFTQIQQMLNDENDEEIIKLCVGTESELSNEVAKRIMGHVTSEQKSLKNIM